MPVRGEVLSCYDRYLAEREACSAAEGCDFVLVNLRHPPLGRPMSDDTVRKWLASLSRRAGLERIVTPHMFRHATATDLLARGVSIDVVKELLGHASIRSTELYLNSRKLHQPGEKPQVTRSRQGRDSVPRLRMAVV